jgi:oligopeptide transport system substrate-binding protein
MKSSTMVRGALAALLATGLVAAGCSSSDSDDEGSGSSSSSAEVVDLANFPSGPLDNIDPALTTELTGAQITTELFDGLTEFAYPNGEGNGELKGLVAEKWESNADATEWTFTIKDGLVFSNGDPVLPSSFVAGWNRAADPELAAGYGYLFDLIQGKAEWDAAAEAGDDSITGMSGLTADDEAMTLTVKLDQPYADFAAVVSHIIFSPVPEQVVADLEDQSQWDRGLMIGNGPFQLDAPRTDQEIVLVPNESWAGDVLGTTEVSLDKITFTISKDLNSAFSAFQGGEGQTATIPDGQYAIALPGGEFENANTLVPQLGSYHFVFGMQEGSPVAGPENLKLRQAISLAIDREQINTAVYDGSRQTSTGITPPGIPGFTEDLCEYCDFDLAQAKDLYAEWEADGGTLDGPLKIQFNADSGHEDVVAIIQSNLQELGIETEQDARSSETYFDEMSDGGCTFCRTGWFWDYPIYDNGMYDLFSISAIGPGANNLGQYSSEEFSDLVADARATLDEDERNAKLVQSEQIVLNQDTVAVPINWYKGTFVYKDLENFWQEPLGWVRWEQVKQAG